MVASSSYNMILDILFNEARLHEFRRGTVKIKISFSLLSLLLCGFVLHAQRTIQGRNAPQAATASDTGVVTIQAVLTQVRSALVNVQADLKGKQLPPLASVDLTLQTVVSAEGGPTIKLWIISLGATREKDETQTVTIHLTPPSANNAVAVGAADLTKALETAIVSAAEGAQQSGTPDYPLKFSGLTVQLEFAVKTAGNASINIPQIVPITAELSGKVSKNATQTIKIVFQDPTSKPPAKPAAKP
jgi:hypothetical protein